MRYYEDYKVGETFHTDSRTITPEEVDRFVEYIGVRNPLFLNADQASKSSFHTRITPGFLTQSLALGLLYRPHIIQNFLLIKAQTHFLKPLNIGDTIHVQGKVTHKKTTKQSKTGHLTLNTTILNQTREKVATMRLVISLLKQPNTPQHSNSTDKIDATNQHPQTTPPLNTTKPPNKTTPHATQQQTQPLPRKLARRGIQTTPKNLRSTLQTKLESSRN